MSGQKRLPPWHEHFRLRDGRELLIRPIRQEDAAPIRGTFPLFEPSQIRGRFLSPADELPNDVASRLCSPDNRTTFTLVAAEPITPGDALVSAVGSVKMAEGSAQAEYAIVVSGFIAGQGVARHLLRRLVKWAKGRGVKQLNGEVLDGDTPMLQLVKSLGFQVEPGAVGTGLSRVVLSLAGPQAAPAY